MPLREITNDLGFSLGKLHYCLQALKKKGFCKINNFKKKDKITYIQYVILRKALVKEQN